MLTAEGMMKKLLQSEGVYAAFIPTLKQLELFFEKEASIESSTGMPIHNKSLEESMKRRYHVCVFQKLNMVKINHHVLTMINKCGELAGFDVPASLKHEVEGRDDLIWISDDFVLDPVYASGPCKLVMNPYPTELFSEVSGILNTTMMIPAAPVDDLMRDTYLINKGPGLTSAIVSFDIDPEEFELCENTLSAACYQTSKVHCY